METMRIVRLGVIIFLCQELSCGLAEESSCLPGFESELLVFKVHREHLHRGKRLGRITFNTCDGRTRTHFQSVDKRFDVNTDGVLSLKRPVTLHEGHKVFSVHAWDSSGKKHTAFVRVERAHNHEEHHMDTEMESPSDFLVLTFPKSSSGLKRRKRGWVVPPINEAENSKGPFPKKLVQIKSDFAKEARMVYSITGEGADLDPKGLFTIERLTGILFVTQSLDREKKASYRLIVHAVGADVSVKEAPMEVIVHVIDQNDNRPVFTQNPFNGHVPESAPKDFEFMKVTATDADEPDNDNSDVRYTIVSQDPPLPKPKMFDINTVTGGIRVIETGLDREKYSRYTLVIRAADMAGEGRSTTGTAVITVTDSDDNAPQFKNTTGRKGGWVIPPFNEPENSKGLFPKMLVQINSDYAKEARMVYSITGEGADLDPKGLFTIDKHTGILFVTQPLDREKKASYLLIVHAVGADDASVKEAPMEVIVHVIDQNDNTPVFTQNPFNGHVPESAPKDYEFMTVTATDADEPDNDNSDVRYKIISQDPPLPNPNMFDINNVTGGIRVVLPGLDRKQYSRYTLVIRAADMAGEGHSTTGTAVITVTDSNDNAPRFEQNSYTVSVPENEVGMEVARLPVTDDDEPGSAAWSTKYRIVSGDLDGFFNVSTGPSQLEGIITTAKPLDYEKINLYNLWVIVENDDPLSESLPTSTATVTVNVRDVKED